MRSIFTAHPAEVGETYFQHMAAALGFAGAMLFGALACLVHAFLPGLCVGTGSGVVRTLHDRMVTNRARHAAATPSPRGPRSAP